MDALPNGSTLQGGAYAIERVLAHGGFGFTYAARDEKLNRTVAIKEFFPSGCRRDDGDQISPAGLLSIQNFETGRARFLEEARALAAFHHPGIVAVHTFFEENNSAYVVMEFLRGQTLARKLEGCGRLSEREIIRIALQLGEALEVVHASGRLHRDLKPDNIIACDDGRIVLVDFGLSTRFVGDDAYGTRQLDDALRFGTPGYAPLEQYTQSGGISFSTDIYALGATLYHLLTGEAPPPATDRAFGTKLRAPRHATTCIASTHPTLCDAILWALRMKPRDRPPSVRAFLDRLCGRDDIQRTRIYFLELLALRIDQLQIEERHRARRKEEEHALQARHNVSTPAAGTRAMTGNALPASSSSRDTSTLPPPQDDNSGCFQFAFVAYLVIWLLAASICAAAFFARFVLFGW